MGVRVRLRKNSVASQVSQCTPDSTRGTVSKNIVECDRGKLSA